MEVQFVDTNIFLRHLTNDDPQKAEACFELFKKAARDEVALVTADWVIAEVVYLLSSKTVYNLSSEEVKTRLFPLLSLRGLKIPNQKIHLRALDLYGTLQIDYEDCLSVAYMAQQGLEDIYSYDRHFDRVEQVKRLEP